MSLKNKLMILVLLWVLLGASNALAVAHDHSQHQHHQGTIVSPFDGKKEVRSLNCLLKGHTHQNFCPHSKPERSQTATIATDCGGKTSSAIPGSASFYSDFAETRSLWLNPHSPNEKLTPILVTHYQRLIDSLDPPPRIL